jgi:hypothetical protein
MGASAAAAVGRQRSWAQSCVQGLHYRRMDVGGMQALLAISFL